MAVADFQTNALLLNSQAIKARFPNSDVHMFVNKISNHIQNKHLLDRKLVSSHVIWKSLFTSHIS